uniref:Uncharacterized protein n=1 Tax=Lygus hesperus TaxID=30085 RepID=A0A146M3Z5_LYGHE
MAVVLRSYLGLYHGRNSHNNPNGKSTSTNERSHTVLKLTERLPFQREESKVELAVADASRAQVECQQDMLGDESRARNEVYSTEMTTRADLYYNHERNTAPSSSSSSSPQST